MKNNLKKEKFVFLKSEDPRVTVGKYTYGFPNFKLWDSNEKINIGKFCSISRNVDIFGGGEHITEWVTTFPLRIAFEQNGAWEDGLPATKGHTIIGNDVWIGDGAKVLSGVTVGHGAVIGAGSVIAKDIPPYAIVGGNPAQIIRYRFSNTQIQKLISIKWWDWSESKIFDSINLLCSQEIDKFIAFAMDEKMEIS